VGGAAAAMQTAGKSEVLAHSNSDESLYEDLQRVVAAPKEIISKTIGSRSKQERKEIHRILGHLPTVNDARLHRGGTRAAEQEPLEAPAKKRMPDTPRSGASVATRSNATPRSAATPRSGGYTPNALGPVAMAGAALAGGASTPRSAASSATPRARAMATDGRLTYGSGVEWPDSKKTQAHQEATERHLQKLAEIGVDPQGMKSDDILRIFYARACPTSYRRMNVEAEGRLNVRAHTPQCLEGVLTSKAQQEVRRARDVPLGNVHQCLDKWEIDTLAEVCRSVIHFDELSRGHISEYKNKYMHGATRRPGAQHA